MDFPNTATGDFRVGEQVIVGKEIRELKALIRNNDGDLVVAWRSKYGEGACLPSSWQSWRDGVGENY